ncbi:hypothetical protein LBMAG43_02730 [Methylococcaceae bacterium]|nr:hypothetical protein LBMAG43_02730 [Methylococcaceae bacterium]
MKKNNLLQGAIVALLVASPLAAFAGQYPAADFEPKILYQDESIKSSATSVKASPAAAPATVASKIDDSKYPAANFEPKVLFSDASYTAPKSTASSVSSEYSTSSDSSDSVIIEASKKENDNSLFLLLGALAVAGFAASRCPKFTGVFGINNSTDEGVYANRETGVTRYLNARIPKVSGVTKYLERAGRPTNVARYIAKQNIVQKAAAAKNDANRG